MTQNFDNQSLNSSTIDTKSLILKIKQYQMLLKFRLSFLVVFSGAFGYFLALDTEVNWVRFIAFVIGSFLITGSANTINQIIEKETDKLMKRTANRPLPTGRLSVSEATTFAILLALVGSVLIASFVNVFSACLSLFSLILYAFVYTPLKPKTPFAVLVGAFPGALPPLIGWVAASGSISMEAMIIFSIQFIWQFPHFWAIAWVANDDYTNAGFKLLPSEGGRNFNSAFQIMIYTMFLIPLGLLPSRFGIVGISSGIIATICGILFLFQTFYLLREGTVKSALRLMFGSFIYLPVVQIAYLIDKL
jgi:protoheme IX farnesyltransferase